MVVVFAENRVRLEYLGIADRKGLALANSQRPPGSYAERPWDELSSIKPNLVPAACPIALQEFSQIWRASLVSGHNAA